jgi:Asp-tRNA(Asn)/Glu-tRNA(Gln) amidotransferase A subunit family amidase
VTPIVASRLAAHRARTCTPLETVHTTFQRIRAVNDAAIFIALRDEAAVLSDAATLARGRQRTATLWHTRGHQGQLRRRRPADDGRLPRLRLCPWP